MPKYEQLWYEDKTGGRYIPVLKQGRKWLHVQIREYMQHPVKVDVQTLEKYGRTPIEDGLNVLGRICWVSATAWAEYKLKERARLKLLAYLDTPEFMRLDVHKLRQVCQLLMVELPEVASPAGNTG